MSTGESTPTCLNEERVMDEESRGEKALAVRFRIFSYKLGKEAHRQNVKFWLPKLLLILGSWCFTISLTEEYVLKKRRRNTHGWSIVGVTIGVYCLAFIIWLIFVVLLMSLWICIRACFFETFRKTKNCCAEQPDEEFVARTENVPAENESERQV
jgi:hypothetical protein